MSIALARMGSASLGADHVNFTIYRDDQVWTPVSDFATGQSAWRSRIMESFPEAKRIGVIAPTSVEGIACWRAIIGVGATPILLQYPTPKLSRLYWEREIANAVETMGIDAIAYWGELAKPGISLPLLDLTMPLAEPKSGIERSFEEGAIIQLSSGTTGFRKGVGFSIRQVMSHVSDYNKILQLGPGDCIVSWLPLYHDMGFVANFVMPLILGVPVVMIDPVTWVRRPEILFEVIERHHGTHCFMPNFGFEVMARRRGGSNFDLSSMRQWISCSEPTRINSLHKFMDATQTDASKMANCYAMAENIFAVAQGSSLRTRSFGKDQAVSCGPAIPGVSLKIVDDQVWVRSPYSIRSYDNGNAIIDDDGFYPTGDCGQIIDNELFIQGRKRDIIIHAGRKLILTDIDHQIAGLFPDSAGRIATIGVFNELLATEDPLSLVESDVYWLKNRERPAAAILRDQTGVENAKVEFVAPGFITKTSSGKINRSITAGHWINTNHKRLSGFQAMSRDRAHVERYVRECFPSLLADMPFELQLDSLGLVNMELILGEYGIDAAATQTLNEVLFAAPLAPASELERGIKIVSIFDKDFFGHMMAPVLDVLRAKLGIAIEYEHICVPPAPILLSDLIFDEQFSVRDARDGVYTGLTSSLDVLRDADLILVDDLVQMMAPDFVNGHYPKISHRFETAPLSGLMAVRHARYSERNHLIATDVVKSKDITPRWANKALADLEDYLGTPMLRLAVYGQFAGDTADWDVQHFVDPAKFLRERGSIDFSRIANLILEKLISRCSALNKRDDVHGNRMRVSDQSHWCSWLVNPDLVDFIVENFDSILAFGKPGSIPYLSQAANKRGKKVTYRFDLVCPPGDDFDCVVMVGAWGRPVTDKPVFPLMWAGWGDQPMNLAPAGAKTVPRTLYEPGTLFRDTCFFGGPRILDEVTA